VTVGRPLGRDRRLNAERLIDTTSMKFAVNGNETRWAIAWLSLAIVTTSEWWFREVGFRT
jgi:hypothetical protein